MHALNTLSRLKGIETWRRHHPPQNPSPLNTLSRLKGIETCGVPLIIPAVGWSLNTLSRLKGIETKQLMKGVNIKTLWIHFPVWRELKLYLWCHTRQHLPNFFEYTFPFEGNWNVLPLTILLMPAVALNPLSRLKGIETHNNSDFVNLMLNSESTFPFEGNWNYSIPNKL